MSKRELGRIEVLARVRSKQLQVADAGRLMRVSYRQAKRLWKRYREEGAKGLKHRSAGRPSHHAHEPKFRQKVLQLVRKKYGGLVGERFGPTLAAEHLESEDRLKVDSETLRRWMLAEGLWSRERKRRAHRRRRERKEHFGELVQMDGSFHAWLEERGPEGCLIDMIDDATNTTWAQLGEQETIWAVADTLRVWIERNGVPLALYVDWKNLYKRPATPGERLRGEEPITQFGRMCAKLDIEVIAASSAQAKGARGAGSWHASGPLGEKTAAEGDQQSRTRQRVSGAGLFAGTQPAFRAGGRQAGGLSPSRAARCRTGPGFPARERTHD
jgi:transposase